MNTKVLMTRIEQQADNKQVISKGITAWIANHVEHKFIADNARSTVDYFKENGEYDDEGNFTAWCMTLVSSSFGQFIPVAFLHDVLWYNEPWEDLQALFLTNYDFRDMVQSQGGLFDNVTNQISEVLNKVKPATVPGNFYIGYHESDGALGIYYTETGEN